jgi:hypothetical protein
MSYKTTLNGSMNGSQSSRGASPTRAVFGNAAGVVHDFTELLELQVKLFAADVSAVKRRIVLPIAALVLSICVTLAILPVLLVGVAELFIQHADLSRATAFFASAGCGALVASILALVGWWRIRAGLHELQNSREELRKNIEWIKKTLRHGGQERHAAQRT